MINTYYISQILVIFAMLSLGMTYLTKNKKLIVILGIIYSALYGIQYLLLGAITGFAMNIVNIIRNIWFYINSVKKKQNNICILIILFILIIAFGIISYKDIFSILPILASSIYTYSIWQDNIKLYRYLAIPMSLCWITYNIYSNSLFAIIAELILFTIEIIGIIKLKKSNKK